MEKLQRISFTQTEVGMMNEIVDFLIEQSSVHVDVNIAVDYLKVHVAAKGEMLKKILGEGVIE